MFFYTVLTYIFVQIKKCFHSITKSILLAFFSYLNLAVKFKFANL